MHLAILIIDILIIVEALGLAWMLRFRFFCVASVVFVVLVVFRLHYALNYQWGFFGKYAVTIAIPLIMAWVGNHFAAQTSENEAVKRLWQFVFSLLSVIALGGSFWVLNNDEKEHDKEMSDLRSGIRNDLTIALVTYNNEHPQHQVTSEQFVELTKHLGDKHGAGYPPISRDTLRATVPVIIADIQRLTERWYFDDGHAENLQRQALLEAGPDKTPDERAKIDKQFIDQRNRLGEEYVKAINPVLKSANYLRDELLRGHALTAEDQNFVNFTIQSEPVSSPYTDYQLGMGFAGYLQRLLNRDLP